MMVQSPGVEAYHAQEGDVAGAEDALQQRHQEHERVHLRGSSTVLRDSFCGC